MIQTPSIILVGNAEPKFDYSAYVEKHDLVIRFNLMPHEETEKVGQRTDILCLINALPPARNFIACEFAPPSVKEVWFTNPYDTNIKDEILNSHWDRNKPTKQVTKDQLTRMVDKLYATNLIKRPKENIIVSSGFIVLNMLLEDPTYKDYNKTMICFTWEGWDGHPWVAEKYLATLLTEDIDNRLTILHQ